MHPVIDSMPDANEPLQHCGPPFTGTVSQIHVQSAASPRVRLHDQRKASSSCEPVEKTLLWLVASPV